ncbi:MAG: DUF1640 domain-containing protein [Magnetococcales bacterium]|nr:DUF1640 domain-containing protein [Magnetococcales bacterium]
MSIATSFDAIAYAKRFKAAGFTEQQAEEVVTALREVRDARLEELSTKGDLHEVELKLEAKIEIAKTETIKWMVGLALAQLAMMAGILMTMLRVLPGGH